MKILNKSEKELSFEGIVIPANETLEVTNEVGQRLLALYWHSPLELIEEVDSSITKDEISSEKETLETIEESVVPETKEDEPVINNSFVCNTCKKEFPTSKGLDLHSKRVHK